MHTPLMQAENAGNNSAPMGGDAPKRELFALARLLEETEVAVTDLASLANNGVLYKRFVGRDVPGMLIGDLNSLASALIIVLRNAVRHTREGEIRLDIRSESDARDTAAGACLLRFTVIDTGAGMAREICGRVFDGPELSECRTLVRKMGGEMHIHSLPGSGTTFWFTLAFGPALAPAPVEASTPPAVSARPLRILVAEDNRVNQLIVAEQLNAMGHNPVVVSNGRDALAAVERSMWDAILLDCQMPVMDGFATVASIRAREKNGGAHLWTIGVTASAAEVNRETCLRAGMDDFLPKPFEFQDLARTVSRIPGAAEAGHNTITALPIADAPDAGNRKARMAALFIETTPEIITEMDSALSTGNIVAAGLAAHKLKGGCIYLGARDLHELCNVAEFLARQNDVEALTTAMARIHAEYQRVEITLRALIPEKA